jgi:3-deoxy-D-manno-octulosonic-acid transferase
VIEPAVYYIPVIFGPAYQVSAEAEELVSRKGGFSIRGKEDFQALMQSLIADEEFRRASGKIAGDLVKEKTGVAEVVAEKILKIIKPE